MARSRHFPGRAGSGLEGVDIDPDIATCQLHQLVADDDVLSADRPPGEVDRLAEVGCGGGGTERRPQLVHELLTMAAVGVRQRQHLDQSAGLRP